MNYKSVLISFGSLLAVGVLAGVIFFSTGDRDSVPDLSTLEGLPPAEIESKLDPVLGRDLLEDNQVVELIQWLFLNQPDLGESLLRRHAYAVAGMPTHVGEASWKLVRSGGETASLRLLSVGRDLFPNSPRILSMIGIVNLLANQPIQARQFLEEAYRWDAEDTLTNYYLGGLLINSDKISDRARGKTAMWKVLKSDDARLSELAGLLLLANEAVPFIETEFHEILEVLKNRNTFRRDNENLNVEALRFLINRFVPVLPEEALELGQLLLQFPGSSIEDRLGVIELAQNQERTVLAGTLLDEIDATALPDESPLALRYERALAINAIAAGRHEEGLAILLRQIEHEENPDLLRQSLERALRYEVSVDAERSLLRGFLELPVENPFISLRVLRRLTEISPLRERDYHAYAATQLLSLAPVEVSQWLSSRGNPELAIKTLHALEEPASPKAKGLALVESHLANKDTASAQQALEEAWPDFSPPLANYLQARIHFQADDKEAAIENWIAARDAAAAGDDFQLLKNIGFLALELEQHMNALQSIYTAFASGIPFEEQQLLSLLQLAIDYGTLTQTMAVCEHLVSAYPERSIYQNNLAYFHFLAEESVEESVQVMRNLVKDYPDINQYKLTLAFGLLKAGRSNEASRLIQSTNVDWEEAGTRGQMIYASVLAASDQRLAAEGLIQNLDTASLLPEERALLESF